MKNTVIWSFLSMVALSASGLVAGCDSDEKLARSALGESCDNTASCEDGLKCIDGTCVQKGSSSGGSGNNGEGGEPPGTSGSINTGGSIGKPPVLGSEGESCTKRADCEDGLGCFAQRCQKAGGGEGGEGNGPVGPVLGGVGETCGLTSDCATGLACLPQSDDSVEVKAIGSNSVGVCTQLDTDLEPTGKSCGAECATAADCCELPILQQTATGASSCTELGKLADEIADCSTATGTNGLICLAFAAYCGECTKNTWACTNRACVYTAKCTKTTQVVGGCPAYTRGGTAIPTCDTKTSKCTGPAAVVTGCETDDDCTDTVVADYPTDTCVADECTCHATSGGCYRKCAEPIDCQVGYTCNDDSLCVPIPGCTTNVECIKRLGDIRATCDTELGTCGVPCEHDIDCNPGGLTNENFSQVCGPKNTCVDLGCESDAECGEFPGGSGVRSFCADPVAPVEGVETVRSAITD
jgi:hypothetical protein